jgi:MoaA/NifB/PqqE/SkfB family radical SAM enzyme
LREPPKIVEFEVTLACNLRCIHCYCMAGKKSADELTTNEIMKVMKDLKDLDVWAFDIVGGEPFMRPDIFDLLSYAKDIDLRVMVNTNGTLINEDIVQKLKEVNPDVLIGVSLDGPDPDVNDFVRGKGSFEKAVRGIKLFVEYGFDPVILNVINKRNWKRFEDMISLAKELGVRKIYVDRFIPVGRGVHSKEYLDMDDREWIEAIRHVYFF